MLSEQTNCVSLSRPMIVNYESLQHHVGGSTGSTVFARQKGLWLGGPVQRGPEQKPFTSTWQPLPVLKGIVRAPALLQNSPWPLRQDSNV